MAKNFKNLTELQNLNDRLYKLVEVLKRKQENKETLTIQADLLEEIADEMRELLVN
jgi:hypothetical protein